MGQEKIDFPSPYGPWSHGEGMVERQSLLPLTPSPLSTCMEWLWLWEFWKEFPWGRGSPHPPFKGGTSSRNLISSPFHGLYLLFNQWSDNCKTHNPNFPPTLPCHRLSLVSLRLSSTSTSQPATRPTPTSQPATRPTALLGHSLHGQGVGQNLAWEWESHLGLDGGLLRDSAAQIKWIPHCMT